MANPTDPNDPVYNDPSYNRGRYVFVNGRWQYHDPNAAGSQAGAKDPMTGTAVYGTSYDPTAVPGSAANPTTLGADVTGATLNTTEADKQRAAMAPWLAQLSGESTTGGGAWEDALKRGTLSAQNAAMAVGQSTPGLDYGSALRGITNAQSAAAQQAVGQGNILRAQQEQTATGQLGGALQAQGAQDIQQAADVSGAAQAAREAQAAQEGATQKRNINTISGIGQGIMKAFGMSDGGKVPGEPKVFGDDSRNDTVPAMLSPHEIVLPLHVTQAPDAPERAAAFVRAVQGHKHPSPHYDGGGPVDPYQNQTPWDWAKQQAQVTLAGPSQQAPDVKSGALLDTSAYDANRQAVAANQATMGKAAQGQGPSVAPQELQNATDANIGAALQSAAGRGALPLGALPGAVGAAQQGAAGAGATTAAVEQNKAQQQLTESLLRQREQEQALARAKQQAAWRNTMMNMGIGLQQQQMLTNMLSGGAQGLGALSAASGGGDQASGGYDATGGSIDAAFNAAHGGEVPEDEKRRADAFIRSLRRSA